MESLFLFYLSIPVLTFGFGYYYFTERRRNKLFSQFETFRSETYRIENMEQLKELEARVMIWNDKLKLETEKPWRTELFMLMRDKRNYFKENP
jgi:hypothetical protein